MSKLKALFIRGCNECPEVVGAALIPTCFLPFAIYKLWINYDDVEKRTYKRIFTVMRPDDPRTRFIREESKKDFSRFN